MFLLVAVVISAVGLTVLYVRNRPPSTFDASIEDFQREMQALAPRDGEGHDDGEARPRSRRA